MELTNTNRSRAYPDRLGMDVEDTKKRISVFSFEGMKQGTGQILSGRTQEKGLFLLSSVGRACGC